MTISFAIKTFIWGILLWLAGYVLGIVLFMVVPNNLLGWVIMPFGIALTVWVLLKKFHRHTTQQRFIVSLVWTVVAIIFDYFFLVLLFKPSDGYYKLDVYLYYLSTFVLPMLVGWYQTKFVLKPLK